MMKKNKSKKLLSLRIYAFTIDLFIILGIQKGVLLTYFGFIKTFFTLLPLEITTKLQANIQNLNLVSTFVIFWAYFISSYYLGKGQTIGKMLVNIKMKSLSNPEKPPSLVEIFLRTGGYFSCWAAYCLPFIIPFITKNKKGLPDWFSQTEICYAIPDTVKIENTLTNESLTQLPLVFHNMPKDKKSA